MRRSGSPLAKHRGDAASEAEGQIAWTWRDMNGLSYWPWALGVQDSHRPLALTRRRSRAGCTTAVASWSRTRYRRSRKIYGSVMLIDI